MVFIIEKKRGFVKQMIRRLLEKYPIISNSIRILLDFYEDTPGRDELQYRNFVIITEGSTILRFFGLRDLKTRLDFPWIYKNFWHVL